MIKWFQILVLVTLFNNDTFAQTATVLASQDTRNVSTTPASYSHSLEFHFKNYSAMDLPNTGTGYYSVWGIRAWGDNSGGKAHELAFSDDGHLRIRSGYSPSWESWRRIIAEDNNGNVGIGTTEPQAKLHITDGDLVMQNTVSGYPKLWLKDVSGTHRLRLDYNSMIAEGDHLYLQSSGGNIYLDAASVGIGTRSVDANYQLFVEKGIRTRKIRVDQATWPDYVFHTTYKLPSLQQIEVYIQQHQHLPDVPSADDVQKNGLDVGENQAVLLRKIEELTLYVIEQDKKTEALQKLVDEQTEQISRQQEQISQLQQRLIKQ